MKDTENELKEELGVCFKFQGQRMTMLAKLILGLLKLGSISYSKLSKVINPSVKRSSNFKRIQRFVRYFKFCQKAYIQFVWRVVVKDSKAVVLSIDRTNWKFGASHINILMLGISYKGTAIPLIWKLLDSRRNSTTGERIELMATLDKHISSSQKKQVSYLVADREFIGKKWIAYLTKNNFSFIIRIKANTLIRKLGQWQECSASRVFQSSSFRVLRKKRIVWNQRLYVAGQQLGPKDWLILVSDRPLFQGKKNYSQRWGIEVFFAACKTRGFNFEDTHVIKHGRIFNLIFLVAMAFIWAIKTGEWLLENGYQIPIKRLKKRKAKLFSIFRVGLDHLQELLLNCLALKHEIQLLSCT